MRKYVLLLAVESCLAILLAGCPRVPTVENDDGQGPEPGPPLKWVEKGIEHGGATIALGYKDSGDVIHPVADIQRDGQPLASAMVFAQVVSADGQQTLSEEVATRYTPIYEGKLPRPKDAEKCSVRFRIVLPEESASLTRDVPAP